MRKLFMLAAATLLLVSCSESNIEKAQEAAAVVKKNCGVIVSVADIAAAFSAANPAVTTVAAMAHAICSQAQRMEYGDGEDAWMVIPAEDTQSEPPPLPTQKPPVEPPVAPDEATPAEPEEKPPVECVAVVNEVCIRREESK